MDIFQLFKLYIWNPGWEFRTGFQGEGSGGQQDEGVGQASTKCSGRSYGWFERKGRNKTPMALRFS